MKNTQNVLRYIVYFLCGNVKYAKIKEKQRYFI